MPSRRLGPGCGARPCLRLHPPFTFADSALAQRPATCRHRHSVVPPPCFLEVFSGRFMSRYLFIFFQDNLLSFIYCNKLTLASFSLTSCTRPHRSQGRPASWGARLGPADSQRCSLHHPDVSSAQPLGDGGVLPSEPRSAWAGPGRGLTDVGDPRQGARATRTWAGRVLTLQLCSSQGKRQHPSPRRLVYLPQVCVS